MLRALFLLVIFFLGNNAQAGLVTAVLSKDSLEINSAFSGDKIMLFGVLDGSYKIMTLVTGPKKPLMISRKYSTHGAWLLENAIKLENVDSFYALIAEDGVNKKILDKLTIKKQKYKVVSGAEDKYGDFIEHFIDYKVARGEYQNTENAIDFLADNFFRITINIPQSVEAGRYDVELLVTQGADIIDRVKLPFTVNNSAFNDMVKYIGYNHPGIYGLVAVFGAFILAWLLGFIFKSN